MSLLKELVGIVLENEGDLFTSGLSGAQSEYYELKKSCNTVTVVIFVVFLIAFGIRAKFI